LLASLLGFLTALRFRYGVGVGPWLAFFRRLSCPRRFLPEHLPRPFCFTAMTRAFFGGFDDLAGGSYDVFLLALGAL